VNAQRTRAEDVCRFSLKLTPGALRLHRMTIERRMEIFLNADQGIVAELEPLRDFLSRQIERHQRGVGYRTNVLGLGELQAREVDEALLTPESWGEFAEGELRIHTPGRADVVIA
jgi:hypothetical protein